MPFLKRILTHVILPLLAVGLLMLSANLAIGHLTTKETKARGLSMEAENAIKHAYAACQLHTLLRNLGFDPANARGMVLHLGILNELAEQFVLFPRDTTLEIRKDLQNNLYGIEFSEWLETQPLLYHQRRLTLVATLAEQGILTEKPQDLCGMDPECKALDKVSQPFAARKWFLDNRIRLSRQARTEIEALHVRLHRVLDNSGQTWH